VGWRKSKVVENEKEREKKNKKGRKIGIRWITQ
jgi:hypothetical protein